MNFKIFNFNKQIRINKEFYNKINNFIIKIRYNNLSNRIKCLKK